MNFVQINEKNLFDSCHTMDIMDPVPTNGFRIHGIAENKSFLQVNDVTEARTDDTKQTQDKQSDKS
jgi:hypothetical protein